MNKERFTYDLEKDIADVEKAYKQSKRNLICIALSPVVCLVMYILLEVVG